MRWPGGPGHAIGAARRAPVEAVVHALRARVDVRDREAAARGRGREVLGAAAHVPLADRPMQTVGAITFGGQVEAFDNGASELYSGLRRERCGGVWGKAVRVSYMMGQVQKKDERKDL